jgi:hypothetical protein
MIVLSEEEYGRRLEYILRRDFFPDLPATSPSTDPAVHHADMDLTLGDFQAAYTTEDDASFARLLERLNARRRQQNGRRFADADNVDPLWLLVPPDRPHSPTATILTLTPTPNPAGGPTAIEYSRPTARQPGRQRRIREQESPFGGNLTPRPHGRHHRQQSSRRPSTPSASIE